MHLTSLNRFGGKEDDVFRPQDFLDLDSQDSDNEILAKFNIHGGNKPDVILPPSMLLGGAGGVLFQRNYRSLQLLGQAASIWR